MQKKIVYQHKPDVILSTQIIYGSIKKSRLNKKTVRFKTM